MEAMNYWANSRFLVLALQIDMRVTYCATVEEWRRGIRVLVL
jgi:hypothetical protein